jgi:myo-inositol-1-phosphate synthase
VYGPRVALIGVGNCACSLMQAVAGGANGPGLVHPVLGGYHLTDINIVAAFDIDARKVGLSFAEALFASPNCTTRYVDVQADIPVSCGVLADGIGEALADLVPVAEGADETTVDDLVQALKGAGVDIVVNLLPVGSTHATRTYALAALRAGAAFVNANPERIARDPEWRERFNAAGLPLLGDDLKSQLGATTVHRALLELCRMKGARILRTYQLNVGGNTDFLNMTESRRSASKRESKITALQPSIEPSVPVDAGPSGHVSSLRDHKVAHIQIDGELLLGMPFSLQLRLEVEDSPNAAGVLVDAIRLARIALDRGHSGAVADVCGFLFKSPPEPGDDRDTEARLNNFLAATS